jgi:hypothetical protein
MAVSVVERELLRYVALMSEQQKKSLLEMIKLFVTPGDETGGPMTIEEYNKELEDAESEFDRGEFITHHELLNQIKGW